MSREEFLGHLKKKDMEFGCLYWEFARTGNREDIGRVLIELDYALYKAEDRREDCLDTVIESLAEAWDLTEEAEA